MVNTIRFKLKKELDSNILWASDVHFDSVYCDRKKLATDFNAADKIIISGDFWDVMGGFYDKRKDKMRDGLQLSYYINDLIEDAYKFLLPFKDKIIGWNIGNHELTFQKYSQVDLTALVLDKLGIEVKKGGLSGYYILRFSNDSGKNVESVKIFYVHNTGFGGRRSKGVNAADIVAGERPSADIWIGEHSHRGAIVPLKVEVLTSKDKIRYLTKYFVQGLSYKAADEDIDKKSFEINTGKGLLPIGGININIKYRGGRNTVIKGVSKSRLKVVASHT